MANSKDNLEKYGKVFIDFDDSSTSYTIDSIGGHLGTITGATRVTGWNGKGYAMNFNGSQYINFTNKIIPLGAKSIRFKIKSNVLPVNLNQLIMVNTTGTPNHGDGIGITPSGFIYWQNSQGTAGIPRFVLTGSFNICDGIWHDILLTWDGTTNGNSVKVYIDDMVNPHIVGTALTTESTVAQYDLIIGRYYNGTTYPSEGYFRGQLDQIEIYDKVISGIQDKYFVFHDNMYKYHNGTSWINASVDANENDFKLNGMNNLSHITEEQWKELVGEKSIKMWSDFEDKQYASVVLNREDFTAKSLLGNSPQVIYYTSSPSTQIAVETEVDPYSVYDYIGEKPTLVVHSEYEKDLTINTDVEPFKLSKEMINPVDVLVYTDGSIQPEVTATVYDSPLTRLTGDVELVTSSTTNTDKKFVTEDQEKDVLVIASSNINIKSVENINRIEVDSTVSNGGIAKLVLSFDDGKTWNTFIGDEWYNIDLTKTDLLQYGILPSAISTITTEKWAEIRGISNKLKFAYYMKQETTSSVVKILELRTNIDMKGSWKKAIHGTDYDYEYPSNEEILVSILSNGDYKINY